MDTESNKVALVTGASRGIGRGIAAELLAHGFTVAGTATSQAGADQFTEWLEQTGGSGAGFVLDVADADSVKDAMAAIKERFAAPLVVVNNAGITKDNIVLRMKDEEWNEVLNTNLTGVWRVCKAALRGMTKARWGRIINVSSVVASMGNAGQSNYAAAKAGLEGFTRSLAREVGSRSITVNTVAPGFIETDMTRELPEQQMQAMLSQIPLGRVGRSAEVAAVVAFLAGDGAGYVTGQTVHVNGGMYLG